MHDQCGGENDHDAFDHRREVFGLVMSERMAVVRRAFSVADGEPRQHCGRNVHQAFHSIGEQGDRVGQCPGAELQRQDQQRHDNGATGDLTG